MKFKNYKFILTLAVMFSIASLGIINPITANTVVDPSSVEISLAPGESRDLEKTVSTLEIPPIVDICLLEDETGSFLDDIFNLQGTTSEDIYDTIQAVADAQFAVAGFRDYPVSPHGVPGDYVYRLLSTMSADRTDWLNGVNALSAAGGLDIPESQYDAIVSAVDSSGDVRDCGWRDPVTTPGVQRVLVVATDAPFHLPGIGKPHINDATATIAMLNAENVKVIGLKAGTTGTELDDLANATNGSVQPLSDDGANIAEAILDGLKELTTDVWWEVTSDNGLTVKLDPVVHYDVPGGSVLDFSEKITIDNDPTLQGQTLVATVVFIANSYPKEGKIIGRQRVIVYVPDVTAPELTCTETVNPHGKKTPPAGSTTLPGPKGGMNEDGFYELFASDNIDESLEIFVSNANGDYVFGPFNSGDKVKITEAPGSTPSSKAMGSKKGNAGAISAHIMLNSDAFVTVTDASGNVSTSACFVAPLPK